MSFSIKKLLVGSESAQEFMDLEIDGITADSRTVNKGDAFFALPGERVHGNEFVKDVVRLGAAAIVTDRSIGHNPGVPIYLVNDVRAAFARAARRVNEPQPAYPVAVTGTNGKTSVVSFLRQIWLDNNIDAASVGTLGIMTRDKHIKGELTTPGPMQLHEELRQLKEDGIDHVALEASSHGLDQRRLDGLKFRVAGFTNLSRDHLDYHETMESYHDAKLRLFRELLTVGCTCVINMDDDEAMPFMMAGLERNGTVLTVGENGAYFEVHSIEPEGYSQRVKGRLVGEEVEFLLPLAGKFQVNNALVAFAMAVATGVDPEEGLRSLERLEGAAGRLEKVAEHKGGAVYVDYSHTPDALQTALESLRPFVKGKLIVVFGCGGDRDKGKRGPMGKIALEHADVAILTDDNPRTEDPQAIRDDVLSAAPDCQDVPDRKKAIEMGIDMMEEGDVLLVAGKGHEDYQIIGTEKHDFSDHDVVLKAIEAK